MTHGARALQPNGFRFRFIPRKVPGLSAHWPRRREDGGQPEPRAMAYGPGCPLSLCRRFQYFLFCPFVFVAGSVGYIRPLPSSLLPPPSPPPPPPPPPPPALPRPPPLPPASDFSSLVARDASFAGAPVTSSDSGAGSAEALGCLGCLSSGVSLAPKSLRRSRRRSLTPNAGDRGLPGTAPFLRSWQSTCHLSLRPLALCSILTLPTLL